MADKNFRVKSGLIVSALSTAGIVKTDSLGVISSSSIVGVSEGGTGQTTANNALNALLPIQNGGTVNYTIQSDGTNVSWAKVYNQLIQNAGISVTPRRNINIVGAVFTDNSGTDTTTITFSGGLSSSAISSNVTLAAANKYFVDTTSARTLTLPASPSLGDEIYLFDASGTAGTNNITINSNSGKINGTIQNLIIDVDGAAASLIYTGATYGWRAG
jgi:hypothetical protein